MRLATQIETAIRQHFLVQFLQLSNESHGHQRAGDETHFKLTLVSEQFETLSKVARHRAVYQTLANLMPQFHALALHTYTPDEWQERSQQSPASPSCGGG